jgi:hypothetical protein
MNFQHLGWLAGWLRGHEILRLRAQNDSFTLSVYPDASRLELARRKAQVSVIASLPNS